MGITSKTVMVKIGSRNFKHYKELGYNFEHRGDEIEVKVEDLPKKTHAKVEILCDICKSSKMIVAYDTYNRVVENTGSYVCKKCSVVKQCQTNQERYGVSSTLQSDIVKERIKEVNLKRYGFDNYAKTKECHEKIKHTCLEKYGVEHPSQLQDVKNKREETNLKRYGVKNASSLPEVMEKVKSTNLQKYGVLYTLQSPDVREKIFKTLYQNGTQKTSKQQYYLNGFYGGELNYPIKHYDVDICFPEEKLVIEYDGGGHDLRVTLGRLTQEEFDQKEIIRNNIIKREGYKQMRIVSRKDLLPSDSTLLQMLNNARNYFSTTSHSWITYDIDQSKMFNAEHKDGIPYSYGELRTIKDSDFDTIKVKDNSFDCA